VVSLAVIIELEVKSRGGIAVSTEYGSLPRGQLSTGDRERMMRLREEVLGRLTEARLIMARVLNQEPGTVTGMSIKKPAEATIPEGWVLVEIVVDLDGNAVGYYDPPGICQPLP
jgi:hypothetical protein